MTVMPSPIILEGFKQQILSGSRDYAGYFFFNSLFFPSCECSNTFYDTIMQNDLTRCCNKRLGRPLSRLSKAIAVSLRRQITVKQTESPRREPRHLILTHAVLRSKPLILTSSSQKIKKTEKKKVRDTQIKPPARWKHERSLKTIGFSYQGNAPRLRRRGHWSSNAMSADLCVGGTCCFKSCYSCPHILIDQKKKKKRKCKHVRT